MQTAILAFKKTLAQRDTDYTHLFMRILRILRIKQNDQAAVIN